MASNYFGFTHGSTQYGATGAYQAAGQTGYAVGHTAAAAAAAAAGTYAATRAATSAYDTAYQAAAATAATHNSAAAAAAYPVSMFSGTGSAGTAAATFDYGYGRATQTAFDTAAKTYYQQPAVAATYATTEHYQAKPAYSTTSNLTTVTRTVTAPATTKPAYSTYSAQQTPSYTAAYTNTAVTKAKNDSTKYVTVERNLIPVPGYIPTNITYVQQTTQTQAPVAKVVQQVQTVPVTSAVTASTTNWQTYKKGSTQNRLKPKQPPKPQQLHYCEICKISCAGPQTYREHLEGQKHKKKEAAGKAMAAPPRSANSLRCELCDVTCTGSDAYAAHIRGAKHQKVVKLHTKLGKPIPSTDPVVLASKSSTPSTPTSTPGTGIKEEKAAEKDDKEDFKLPEEKDVQPVGQEYIEELRNDEGKIISFNCKLCECRFNDPNAKEMHMKGRRHRLQYKKKVDPDLQVDIKPSLRQKKIQEEKLRRQALREELWSRRREEERWREEMRIMEEEERLFWEERRRYEEEMEYYEYCRRTGRFAGAAPPMPPPPRHFAPPMMMPPRRPDSSDDRHVIAKHAEIYPKEEELSAIQAIISNAEKALKLVSDCLAEADAPKKEEKPAATTPPANAEKKDRETPASEKGRVLRGVMRVGPLAKGLLLKGDTNVQLVVLCSEKPTRTLLDRVADSMPKQLESVASEVSYELRRCVEEAAIILQATSDPKISVTITLTSPVMREQGPEAGDQPSTPARDPPDVLDKQKCLDALAALRHSKWFQARANGLQSCVMVMRILRELCQRVPTWAPLNCWAMELLVERVIASAGAPLSPGESLRRVFEALACGILLPGGPGLLDPCEKDPTDATAVLSSQEREDITASAQHALRLIAFRQIHKVLGMDPLPVPKLKGRFTRKRRRDNSTGEGADGEGAEGKKDKKEDGDQLMEGVMKQDK